MVVMADAGVVEEIAEGFGVVSVNAGRAGSGAEAAVPVGRFARAHPFAAVLGAPDVHRPPVAGVDAVRVGDRRFGHAVLERGVRSLPVQVLVFRELHSMRRRSSTNSVLGRASTHASHCAWSRICSWLGCSSESRYFASG